ncbi:MAG: DUF4837 family protein [candidate division WOR-3 bacterium]
MNKLRRLVVSALLAGICCTGNIPKSFGRLREVTVITDYWEQVGRQVAAILQVPVPTPQPEPEFLLRVGGFERFPDYSKLRLVFIIGTSQDSLIRGILGFRADSLGEAGCGLFRLPNAWVSNQQVLVFVAVDRTRLDSGLALYAGRIHWTVTELVLEQMTAATYLEGRDEILTSRLGEYGFSLDVPKRWLLNDQGAGEHFIYIHSHFPDRSVFVFWQDTIYPLVTDSIVSIRDWLCRRFYEGDSVDRGSVRVDTIEFLGVPALRVRGVWQNRQQVIGGPFVFYAFNYQERFFLLDGMVFNPGEKKLSNLFQVEAIIRTFVPR